MPDEEDFTDLLREGGRVGTRVGVGVNEMDLVVLSVLGNRRRRVLVERAEVATELELVVEGEAAGELLSLVPDNNDADLSAEECAVTSPKVSVEHEIGGGEDTDKSFFSSSVNLRRSTPWISTPRAGVMNFQLVAFFRTRLSFLSFCVLSEGASSPRSRISKGWSASQSLMGKEGLRWL